MAYCSRLVGFGGYLPEKIVTNQELSQSVDTSDEWIRERTGIKQRHIISGNESCNSMAAAAAQQAMDYAGLTSDDIDAIVVATCTPDQAFPTTAAKVQQILGMKKGFAFDISSACAGFVFGLSVADNFIRNGQAKNVLLIGSEVYSRILDWSDRRTCVLFGDGAGAVVLSAEEVTNTTNQNGILGVYLHTDGQYSDLLYVDGVPSKTGDACFLKMHGKEVFRHAVTKLSEVVEEALTIHHLTHDDIDWLVPHQANLRIISGMGKKLNLPADRVIATVDRHANTSAASVPLALNEAVRDGRIKKGDLIVIEALGGGLSWGSSIIRL
ncbi:3-oxoacyl-[acyl-carrier-protein] synthase III (FabH) (PDB:1UB7) [Commensalibacter communis]|uniref:beta-ketoacyl-ACP synthase III n=1 Tax=Commensalibacter communis TaxID=2972786 RepID=UPI0022FF66CE|nr:beta-ketoacyl-ACP synthase III [Commensalibacter communis]CAI3925891.1 3-oxoacyl-[acyl-carrier-protein] synthase III (FabH) (PDB:1UB7) [Commensalibacter communis]CAI3933233.1 3-oxoacyl-[acyl-carrier-protein] synthase III (FabH) (PDB:1UB7) [Commensalibacter communis]